MWTVASALDDEWRPDIAGFVIASNDMQIFIDVDPANPQTWRAEPYYSILKRWSARNKQRFLTVIVRTPTESIVIFPEADIILGPPRQGVEVRSGYRLENGQHVPFAHFDEQTN
jgi:hypothetical protein